MHFRRTLLVAATAVSSASAALSIDPLITLDFAGEMTPIQRQTFLDAADFWNSVITGYDLVSDGKGDPTPHSLIISASVVPIDGVGSVLGSAGPTLSAYYDNDPFSPNPTLALNYASAGAMEFDSADVANLVAANSFYGVVLHEMAHVLGIGTLWTDNNVVNGVANNLYITSGQYTGPKALPAWQSEFNRPGDTFVPVELGGGAGTANGHWNEVDGGAGLTGFLSADTGMDFKYEFMTGWANAPFFVSSVTLGALDDLGYQVDHSKAGVVDHVVVVPEASALLLAAASGLLACGRRR